jgi:hypothetical protein
MPAWFEQFSADVKDLHDKAAKKTSGASLERLQNSLIKRVLDGTFADARKVLKKLDPFFNRAEQGRLVIMKALMMTGAGPKTVESVIDFICQYKLLPKETIAEIFFTGAGKTLPPEFHKAVLESLANRWMKLDALLGLIDRLGIGEMVLPLLAKIEYRDGPQALCQSLLKYGRRYPALFPRIVTTLLSPGMEPGITVQDLVVWALGFEKRYREEVTPLLLARAYPSVLDLEATLKRLYEISKTLVERLLSFLLAGSGPAGPEGSLVTDLLRGPLNLYPGEPEKIQGLFLIVFTAMAKISQEKKFLDVLMQQAVAWLQEPTDLRAPLTRPMSLSRASSVPELSVSMPVWLVASALKSLAGSGVLGQGLHQALTAGLVRPLVGLSDTRTRDNLLGQFFAIDGLDILMLPVLVIEALLTPMHIWEWFGQDVLALRQKDRPLKIKELGAPSETSHRKYMIFSDLHRDPPEDVIDPVFFDVSHFTKNKEIYKNALSYCESEGYTVIENGDCEELWYPPAMHNGNPAPRALSILNKHDDVYDILFRMHQAGRYFRTRGNHDDYWVNDGDMTLLRGRFQDPNFTIWDALVIPEVKTMESELWEVLWKIVKEWDELDGKQILELLLGQFEFGLSPDHYQRKKPLFILHGHQMDFWNCDEHNYLGKAITRGIGFPADGIDALPYFLKGIDWDGNPLIKFWDIIAKIFPWDYWPPEDFALDLTRRIENVEELDRKLQDSLSFSETFAALLPAFLKYNGKGPSLIDPAVQILIGHTHYPQSRPHLNLHDLIPSGGLIERLVKVSYFNSGSGGWWEGVVWAVEITEKGQPRLVYWERNSPLPHLMSWELHAPPIPWQGYLDPIKEFFEKEFEKVGKSLKELLDFLAPRVKTLANFEEFQTQMKGLGGKALSFDLTPLSPAQQYQSLSLALWVLLRDKVAETKDSPAALEIKLPLGKIPLNERSFGGIQRLRTPVPSLNQAVGKWLDDYSKVSPKRWTFPKPDTLAGLFFVCANLYGSGLMNLLGMMVLAVRSLLSMEIQIRYDAKRGELALRFQQAHSGKLRPSRAKKVDALK